MKFGLMLGLRYSFSTILPWVCHGFLGLTPLAFSPRVSVYVMNLLVFYLPPGVLAHIPYTNLPFCIYLKMICLVPPALEGSLVC